MENIGVIYNFSKNLVVSKFSPRQFNRYEIIDELKNTSYSIYIYNLE